MIPLHEVSNGLTPCCVLDCWHPTARTPKNNQNTIPARGYLKSFLPSRGPRNRAYAAAGDGARSSGTSVRITTGYSGGWLVALGTREQVLLDASWRRRGKDRAGHRGAASSVSFVE
jgi:hypothetical protein